MAWVWSFSGLLTSILLTDSVRCVRGGGDGEEPSEPGVVPANQYSEIASGKIQDNYTGLVWQELQSEMLIPRADAVAYCSSLTLGGKSWRMPSPGELSTLHDEARVRPALNADVFPDTEYNPVGAYWAFQSFDGRDASFVLDFSDGHMDVRSDGEAWVKCVR
ncbi:MAG TPA: DUF1566 domain-containing protein [Polyangiaceae bacterium]